MARRPARRAPKPIALEGIATYPLASRKSKVTLDDFGRPPKPGARVRTFLEALPRQLAGDTLRRLAADILLQRALGLVGRADPRPVLRTQALRRNAGRARRVELALRCT